MSRFSTVKAVAAAQEKRVNVEERVSLKSALTPFGVYDVTIIDAKERTNIILRDGAFFVKDKDGAEILVDLQKDADKLYAKVLFDMDLTNETTKEIVYATYEIDAFNIPANIVAGIPAQLPELETTLNTAEDALAILEEIMTEGYTFKMCNSLELKEFKKDKETIYFRTTSFNLKKIENARKTLAEMND